MNSMCSPHKPAVRWSLLLHRVVCVNQLSLPLISTQSPPLHFIRLCSCFWAGMQYLGISFHLIDHWLLGFLPGHKACRQDFQSMEQKQRKKRELHCWCGTKRCRIENLDYFTASVPDMSCFCLVSFICLSDLCPTTMKQWVYIDMNGWIWIENRDRISCSGLAVAIVYMPNLLITGT